MTKHDNSRQSKQRKTKDIEDKARSSVRAIFANEEDALDAATNLEREEREDHARGLPERLAIGGRTLDEAFDTMRAYRYEWYNDFDSGVKLLSELDYQLRIVCADRLEGELPPTPWRDFALSVLRRLAPPPKQMMRRLHDFLIFVAVKEAESAGLNPTRNRAQRYKDDAPHSACSLVADELEKRGIKNCGEDAVEKIWKWGKRSEKSMCKLSDGK
jgi:hypothetical protein